MSSPASQLSQQSKEILHLSTCVALELLVVFVQIFWNFDCVIFDFILDHGVDIELDALTVLVSFFQ